MGFAQEMKDFLGAYQTGMKINASVTDREYKASLTEAQKKKTERDNDPETLALADKKARAELAKTQAGIGAIGASTALTNERRKNVIQARDLAISDRAAAAKAAATNTNGIGIPSADDITGQGAIPAYAEGGLVEDDGDDDVLTGNDDGDEDMAPPPPPRGAIMTDVSSQSRPAPQAQPQGLNGVVAPAAVFDATKAGLAYGIRTAGLDKRGIRSRAATLQAQQLASGTGGMTQQEMDSVRKAVDPQGKMTDSQRNMAALGAVYQFNMKKGNIGGAEKIAFGMLQHFRVASQRYAAISANAAKDGNLDLATAAAVKAYANVPDGRDLKITKTADGKLQYSVIDENGKQITAGIATPQQLAAQAMGMATGGFDKAILQAAGQRAQTTGEKPSSYNSQPLDKRISALDTHVEEDNKSWAESPEGKKATEDKKLRFDPELAGDLKDAATHIIQDNPKVTPREAWKTAQQLYAPPTGNNTSTFSVVDSGDDGTHTLKVGSHKIKVTDDQLETIMNRQAAIRAAEAKDREGTTVELPKKGYGDMALDVGRKALDVDTAAGRGTAEAIDTVKRGAGLVGGALGDAARYAGRSLVDDETAIRVGSAANRLSAIPSDVADNLQRKYDALRNRGDVPPVDAPL